MSKVLWALVALMMFVSIANADELDKATEMVAKFEGFRASPYKDRGQVAIGYGTEVGRAKAYGYKGGKVTEAQAKSFLKAALKEEQAFLKKTIPSYPKLTDNQQAALLSMSYNSRNLIGPNLKGFIARKDWTEAAREIGLGHNATLYGLIKRRAEEANTFAGRVVITERMVAAQR